MVLVASLAGTRVRQPCALTINDSPCCLNHFILLDTDASTRPTFLLSLQDMHVTTCNSFLFSPRHARHNMQLVSLLSKTCTSQQGTRFSSLQDMHVPTGNSFLFLLSKTYTELVSFPSLQDYTSQHWSITYKATRVAVLYSSSYPPLYSIHSTILASVLGGILFPACAKDRTTSKSSFTPARISASSSSFRFA
ncbi:hypothetical protein K504DRAFT_188472 [Pleomassaria siparia CBS 279.74]|uniref:Uncharacterized protein n=1 Tax=Pleomassaria siparia CBS 279.74 TaxID=1314801 RepID=A0A6G1JRX7_9PLEO|nr:hypothetical protein K504DRAFT_188472 [Pleomassaria siparia CBS 279.74]